MPRLYAPTPEQPQLVFTSPDGQRQFSVPAVDEVQPGVTHFPAGLLQYALEYVRGSAISGPSDHAEIGIELVDGLAAMRKNGFHYLYGGDLLISAKEQLLRVNSEVVPLAPTEFRVLHYLSYPSDTYRTRSEILQNAYRNRGFDIGERSVDVAIRRIRAILREIDPIYGKYDGTGPVTTIRKGGYRTESLKNPYPTNHTGPNY